MTKKSDKVREEIARTKADLAQKLGQLESQVRDDTLSARETLEGAIENVKSTAKMFSLTHQVQQRPLLMAGGSMVTGLIFTRWLMGGRGHAIGSPQRPSYESVGAPSVVESLVDRYPEEVRVIKTMAFSFLVNLIAEKAKAGLPHLVDSIGAIERRLKDELAARK